MGKKAFGPDKTRTLALAGHRSSGKTSGSIIITPGNDVWVTFIDI